MNRRSHAHGYSLRDLQSLLGVSRRVLSSLIEAGFIAPSRGRRNELRFSFRDVVLLRTAFQLQSARIPSRRILHALSRLKAEMPEEVPLSGVRLSAVGDAITVRTGHTQWDANSGQMLLDFGEAQTRGGVTFLDSAPANLKAREKQAADWYTLAEQLHESDPEGAEKAYRKALELSPEPHYHAYANLGALLARDDNRCADALAVFEAAIEHFEDAELLHYNRAVLLEHLNQLEEAAKSYLRCIELNPDNDEPVFNRAVILEELGRQDEAAQAYVHCLRLNPAHEEAPRHLAQLIDRLGTDTKSVIRHLSALRRSTV
ncbi:tetratricopeptide repeat protein [Burkholderia sp. Bp9125]|nr:tetratricopeptide repeat protein [Burkholderia sp. Bp9125]